MAQTDEEQVEELRKWWKKNGNHTLLGLIIGFWLFFGWRAWQQYEDYQAGQASYAYADILKSLKEGKTDVALKAAARLPQDFSHDSYITLSYLLQAKLDIDAQYMDKAEEALNAAIKSASLPEMKEIAYLRLARLQANEKKYTAAEASLAAITINDFKSLVEIVKGDIAYAQNQSEAAAKAYDIALQDNRLTGKVRQSVQMRRDNINSNTDAFSAKTVVPEVMYQPPVQPTKVGESNAATPLGLTMESSPSLTLQNNTASPSTP